MKNFFKQTAKAVGLGLLGGAIAGWTSLGPAQETSVVFNRLLPGGTNQFGDVGFVQSGAPGGRAFGTGGGMVIGLALPGEVLMKALDQNQDGSVTLAELKLTAAQWCLKWDTDTNGLLTTLELAAGLKQLFPEPQLAPEMPRPPEEFAIYNVLARRLTPLIDLNTDDNMPFAECETFLETKFARWEQDGNAGLNADECAAAFHEIAMPEGTRGVFISTGGAVDVPADGR